MNVMAHTITLPKRPALMTDAEWRKVRRLDMQAYYRSFAVGGRLNKSSIARKVGKTRQAVGAILNGK
jgi:hypothetical protein